MTKLNELKIESKVFNEFEFLDNLKPYSDAFGKENMKIVFLEELADINSQSIKLLANLFDVTTEEMFSLINKKKNVQQKGKVMKRSTLNNKYLKRIWHFYNSNIILRRLKPIISKLSFLKKTYVLADVTDNQKDQVFNLYKEYNKRFAAEFNLVDRMEKLKYF